MFDVRAELAKWLVAAADRLAERSSAAEKNGRFVDLAPTDDADPAGVYSAALTEAIGNPRVLNIALTGPYGSGKSSIIQSFLKEYRRDVLQISLASFLPEARADAEAGGKAGPETIGRQEIERSILQQMLYGPDADRLPLSRFKRIQSPGRLSALASLFITFGLVACWHLVQRHAAIASGDYFRPLAARNGLNLLAFVVGVLFLWAVCHRIYVASFGISLKSISLKDIEITPKAATEESILNRHLDEIVYFFQSTSYDLVVIEDLDRFNNSDIFVTLREINGLVNANAGVRRTVRFLYALRDDMFTSTDRTKFFEFIIPVIPIINSSNAIDKVLEQGRRLSIEDRLDRQFLREVSRYLDDLRLIQNIFNEYAIYIANLDAGGGTALGASKLLAVLIYKNVFPSDFEQLHRGHGNLARVLRDHARYVANGEARLLTEIKHAESLAAASGDQLPRDVEELRRIYAMALVELLPDGCTQVQLENGGSFPVNALSRSDALEGFIDASHVFAFNPYAGGRQRVSLAGLQAKVDPTATFQERKDEVERKSPEFRDATAAAVKRLRADLAGIRLKKFHEVLRENVENLDAMFAPFGDRAELARFLVLEGYLDDTYFQYTSLFHSGRLSPNDNRFLIRIRGFSNPEPGFQIDNAREVVAEMRDEDFSRDFALNVRIVDCLLGDPSSYEARTARLVDFIASSFAQCETFLATYYERGAGVPALIARLARGWQGFVAAILASPASLAHATQVLAHLPDEELAVLADSHPEFTAYLARRLPEVLTIGVGVAPERLRSLDFRIVNLPAVQPYPGFVESLFDTGRYELTVVNIDFVLRSVLGLADDGSSGRRNYTLVLENGGERLSAEIDARFGEYLENVLLRLPENNDESPRAILRVLERDDLDREAVVRFLARQSTLLPSLDEVPSRFHRDVLELGRIAPTWTNCIAFLAGDEGDAAVLTDFLNREDVVAALAGAPIPGGEAAAPLRRFIVENEALEAAAYAAYVDVLPNRLTAFPDGIGAEKVRTLVDRNRVIFSPEALAQLDDDVPAAVDFVRSNLQDFFDREGDCELTDDFRERLLEVNVGDADRLRILRSMDLGLLADRPGRAAIVGSILVRTGEVVDNLDADAARAVILAIRPLETQIKLFNLLQARLDDEQVRDLLRSLPHPLSDIRPGWSTPRLGNSEVNRTFATWLKARDLISSWKLGGLFEDQIVIYSFRK